MELTGSSFYVSTCLKTTAYHSPEETMTNQRDEVWKGTENRVQAKHVQIQEQCLWKGIKEVKMSCKTETTMHDDYDKHMVSTESSVNDDEKYSVNQNISVK
jgi:hypothetical protein